MTLQNFQDYSSSTPIKAAWLNKIDVYYCNLHSVLNYGAVGNGVADDTAAIQAAITDAIVLGSPVYFPAGVYKVTAPITVAGACTLFGDGKYSTTITTNSATANIFNVTGILAVVIRDMKLMASVVRTAGAYVSVDSTAAGATNFDSALIRVDFSAPFIGADFITASDWTVYDCYFVGCISIGIRVQNTLSPDTGDSAVFNNTLHGVSGAALIWQLSSGGLRVSGNKFLAATFHYYLTCTSHSVADTGILLFTGNSSENADTTNFAMNSGFNTTFVRVIVADNQFVVSNNAYGIQLADPGYDWLSEVSIGNNMFSLGNSSMAMSLVRVSKLSVQSNIISGLGSSTVGINFGATATAIVSPQDMFTVTTPYAGTLTNVTFSPGRVETGGLSGTTNVGYGTALYSDTVQTVFFAQVYGKAPVVTANTDAANGAVSVLITSVNTAGFNYVLLGVTNGGSVTGTWVAVG